MDIPENITLIFLNHDSFKENEEILHQILRPKLKSYPIIATYHGNKLVYNSGGHIGESIILYAEEICLKRINDIKLIVKELKEKYNLKWIGIFTKKCSLRIELEFSGMGEYLEYITYGDKINAGVYKIKNKEGIFEEKYFPESKAFSIHHKLYDIDEIIILDKTNNLKFLTQSINYI